MSIFLHLDKINVMRDNSLLFGNFSWKINENENWAISGKSGSGKTSLLQTIEGKYPISDGRIISYFNGKCESGTLSLKKHSAFVYFQNQELNYNRYYYQQRYYSTEVEGTMTTKSILEIESMPQFDKNETKWLQFFSLDKLMDKEFIKLSNGETRKVLILKALLKNPKLLVLDDPYLGLDKPSRKSLKDIINQIAKQGVQIIMTLHNGELPDCITHSLILANFKIISATPIHKLKLLTADKQIASEIKFERPNDIKYNQIACFSNLNVRYGDTFILKNLNWEVKASEKWALTGMNGSGKSMLLSLVYADHPQAYANEIVIFDKLRGKGESIWEIKEKIGYVSPEMHFYFNPQLSVKELVFGGLTENPYKTIQIKNYHKQVYSDLLCFYNLKQLEDKKFSQLSTSEQRLFLLFRAIIKNPVILLLDEPFQSFDKEMIEKTKYIVNRFCEKRTLIMVSHDQDDFPACISHFAELKDGNIHITTSPLQKHTE